MRRILAALDASPSSRPAVIEAVQLARTTGAAVTFIAVRRRISFLGKRS